MKAHYKRYVLVFKQASGTSRGILKEKESWFIVLEDKNGKRGIGECGLLRGLSCDRIFDYEKKLKEVCASPNATHDLVAYPSIRFGLEMAKMDLASSSRILFPSNFTEQGLGQNINGLIWMGSRKFMYDQIKEKIDAGFSCIKLKIGAIDFEQECSLLEYIRSQFSSSDIELRVDANGAFEPSNALKKLKRLSQYDIHSIEQPIRPKQWEAMATLCEKSPLAIALDEELIGMHHHKVQMQLLSQINPQYIILKPSLLGGIRASEGWIDLAERLGIGWWVTSALESNVGLNAIAQWTATLGNTMPQGLGTGQLYKNNFDSPLVINNGKLFYEKQKAWDLSSLFEGTPNSK